MAFSLLGALLFIHLQVLGGLVPFHNLRSPLVPFAMLRGERPGKPRNASSLGFTAALWELIQSCWSETSSERPTTHWLLDYLCPAALILVPPPTLGTTTRGSVVNTPTPDMLRVSGVPVASSVYWVQ